MQPNIVAYILLSGLLGVGGQIMLKRGVAAIGPLALSPETAVSVVLGLALNPLVIAGLAVYMSGTFFWLLALSRVDLSFAYPFASLNYVVVLLGAWLILGEQPTLARVFGVLAICLGVWAVAATPARSTLEQDRRPPVPRPAMEGGVSR